jgi:hypothetical protein
MADFTTMRYRRFHQTIAGLCVDRKTFEAAIKVDWLHIDEKADKEQIRANLGSEQLASVLKNGSLNVAQCRNISGSRVEIAVEGCFKAFPWLDWTTMEVNSSNDVYVRVVIREKRGAGLHIIVTAYDLWTHKINAAVNEVPYEIW